MFLRTNLNLNWLSFTFNVLKVLINPTVKLTNFPYLHYAIDQRLFTLYVRFRKGLYALHEESYVFKERVYMLISKELYVLEDGIICVSRMGYIWFRKGIYVFSGGVL